MGHADVVVLLLVIALLNASCGGSPADDGIALPGDTSGAWWDARSSALYLTDDTHHTIVRWTGTAFEDVATLPTARGLGGLVRLADGRFVVTAFGGGTEGGVFIAGTGAATEVPGLDRTRRRTGLALAPDGALYVSYFTKPSGGEARGGVARLDLEHGETDVVTGLAKPIGVAATPLALFVTDQQSARLVSYARTDPAHSETVVTAELVEPDLMTSLPGNDLVIGSKSGVIYRVTPAGSPTVIARGLGQVRGIAFDPATKRLFVIDHGGASRPSRLHVVTVE